MEQGSGPKVKSLESISFKRSAIESFDKDRPWVQIPPFPRKIKL